MNLEALSHNYQFLINKQWSNVENDTKPSRLAQAKIVVHLQAFNTESIKVINYVPYLL